MTGRLDMWKHVLLYGLIGGVLIAGLKAIEYRWLIVEHSLAAWTVKAHSAKRPNNPGSATRPTGRVDCNQDPMAGVAAH